MTVFDNPLTLMARKLETHAALAPADREALLALPIKLQTYEPSSYLVREGDPPTQCAVLVSGFAYRHKLNADGGRQIVSLHIPGEMLDLQHLFLDVADHNVQTLTRTTIAAVSRDALRDLARTRASVGHAMYVNILVEASIFREWILNVGRRPAKERVAHLLCEFAMRLDAQGLSSRLGYELPITQEQLADAVGLTPVHVNRTLKSLEQDGLIERNKRALSFPNWENLRKFAQFSSRYLHLSQQGV